MHHGKLNLLQPISARLGSMISVLIIVGVTMDGPEEVLFHSLLTSSEYSSYGIGVNCLGFYLLVTLVGVGVVLCIYYLFFQRFSSLYYSVPSFSHSVIPQLLDEGHGRGGGVYCDSLLLWIISFVESHSKYSFLTTSVYVMSSGSLDSSFCISNLLAPVPLILGLIFLILRALYLFL